MPELAYQVNLEGSKNMLDLGTYFSLWVSINPFQPKTTVSGCSFHRQLAPMDRQVNWPIQMVSPTLTFSAAPPSTAFTKCSSRTWAKTTCGNLALISVVFDFPVTWQISNMVKTLFRDHFCWYRAWWRDDRLCCRHFQIRSEEQGLHLLSQTRLDAPNDARGWLSPRHYGSITSSHFMR